MFGVKTITCSHTIFTWLLSAMKQLFKKFHFKFLHAFNFSYISWFLSANIVTFGHNIVHMVDSFVFPVNIPVMFYNLYEMVNIWLKKMLNTIYYFY